MNIITKRGTYHIKIIGITSKTKRKRYSITTELSIPPL